MVFSLRGKVALITGSSRGIGRAIALELATLGCHVVLTARHQASLDAVAVQARACGGSASVCATDLRAEQAAKTLAEQVKRNEGRLDILVNNAGAVIRGDFFTLTEQDWQDGFALKFFAHVRLCRAVWPMLKSSSGSVVFISGIGARAPVSDYMIGASVIGAGHAFMRALADIGIEDDVQVVEINPGSVETDRFRQRLAAIMRSRNLDEAAAREYHRAELGITRFGTPEDVAGLVAFAISPRGRWLHGTGIDMDGGQGVPVRMAKYQTSNTASANLDEHESKDVPHFVQRDGKTTKA